jgi:hypothetical protein
MVFSFVLSLSFFGYNDSVVQIGTDFLSVCVFVYECGIVVCYSLGSEKVLCERREGDEEEEQEEQQQQRRRE